MDEMQRDENPICENENMRGEKKAMQMTFTRRKQEGPEKQEMEMRQN